MKEDINFVAIDFETADKYFACQLGVVVVRGGEIVEEKSFLIQPPNNKYHKRNIQIHGITPDKTKNSPTFFELWDSIKKYFEHQIIVFHGNSNHFDLLVLDNECERNGLKAPLSLGVTNTSLLFDDETKSKSLKYLCKIYNITMEKHHDAVSDARCCAMLFLKYLLNENPNRELDPDTDETNRATSTKETTSSYDSPERKISSDTKIQDLESVTNSDTIFYDKKVVISGIFEKFPIRNDLAILLKGYGAKINGSISSKTDIFIVGKDCGEKKMQKVFELKDGDVDILIIEEKDLYKKLELIDKQK